VKVVAALEASSRWRALKALPAVLGNGARLREAAWYGRNCSPPACACVGAGRCSRCEGDGRVQRAVIGKVDRAGRPRRDTARTIEVDVVGAGFGLVPSIELGLLLGCASRYHARAVGTVLVVDERQRTSVAGVFAVGEICGIGGAEVAIAEGALAAAAILSEVRGKPMPMPLVRRARAERRAADAHVARVRAVAGPVRARAARHDRLSLRRRDAAARARRGGAARRFAARDQGRLSRRHGAVPGAHLRAVAAGAARMRRRVQAHAGGRQAIAHAVMDEFLAPVVQVP
jgi:hypothetical protein